MIGMNKSHVSGTGGVSCRIRAHTPGESEAHRFMGGTAWRVDATRAVELPRALFDHRVQYLQTGCCALTGLLFIVLKPYFEFLVAAST
ncbi:MAG: hypothetical protein IM606_10960 [Cytophagales bacterium]|nr:hypothetical protein [Cytophagales bacterium]MCA6389233.1 hypothetical protein [Cytophagales bacterium]MCA6393437.1 hypothetical protein [Cytophagales bacterium]MCA6395696.1 hypothetical protein [Cytophagales bacterium]MCA6411957.1 hypothetical protein [Cytophagales bacterium]